LCVVRIPLKAVKASRERTEMKANKTENTSMRAGIEGTNSAIKRTGLDNIQVRGKIKTEFVFGLIMTAQILKGLSNS
jgi:hypothetical protein